MKTDLTEVQMNMHPSSTSADRDDAARWPSRLVSQRFASHDQANEPGAEPKPPNGDEEDEDIDEDDDEFEDDEDEDEDADEDGGEEVGARADASIVR